MISLYDRLNKRHTIATVKKIITALNKRLDYFCFDGLTSGSYGMVLLGQTNITVPQFKNIKMAIKISFTDNSINPKKIIVRKFGKDNCITYTNTIMGEAHISLLFNTLFVRGITPHVTLCVGLSNCDREAIIYEKLGFKNVTNLNDIQIYLIKQNIKITANLIDSFIVQFLHTLYVLKKNFNFVHMDLFYRNIFIKHFNDDPYFKDLNMMKIKWFKYNIPGSPSIYIRNYGFILKFGDFGFSTIKIGNTYLSNSKECVGADILSKKTEYIKLLHNLAITFKFISPILRQILLNPHIINEIITKDAFAQEVDLNTMSSSAIQEIDLLRSPLFDQYRKIPNINTEFICEINHTIPK